MRICEAARQLKAAALAVQQWERNVCMAACACALVAASFCFEPSQERHVPAVGQIQPRLDACPPAVIQAHGHIAVALAVVARGLGEGIREVGIGKPRLKM